VVDAVNPEICVVRYHLERKVSECPNAAFVSFQDGAQWNRAETLNHAASAANILFQSGVKQGDRVVLFLPTGQAILKAWLGTCLRGATIVPLHVAYRGRSLRHALERVDGSVIVVDDGDPSLRERLEEIRASELLIRSADLDDGSTDIPRLERPINPWDIHSIVLTSGTTGPAKASLTTYVHTIQSSGWVLDEVGPGPADTYVIETPLFHQAALARVVGAMSTGTKLAVRARPDLQHYRQWSRRPVPHQRFWLDRCSRLSSPNLSRRPIATTPCTLWPSRPLGSTRST
jgi:crotonobetaine/carnitine-CoA ligase